MLSTVHKHNKVLSLFQRHIESMHSDGLKYGLVHEPVHVEHDGSWSAGGVIMRPDAGVGTRQFFSVYKFG